ncbi:MAG: tyrosine-type recombinase/integrase [Staphylococcus sp.]|nr:tyrosine-type recombinase/integrase [Staphylococcus sp.]
MLNHAVRFYGLRINPCKIVGYAKVPNEIPNKMRYWTYDEYLKAIDNITDLKSKTAINLLYWTGMRKGELYALTWNKIDFNDKTQY